MYYTTLFIVSLMYSYGFLFKRRFLYWRDKRGHSALFFSKKKNILKWKRNFKVIPYIQNMYIYKYKTLTLWNILKINDIP